MLPLEEQLQVIRRGAGQIVPEDELRKKLERSIRTGKPLRVKYGIDPTGFDVHLGHTVPLRKLRQFQELGHLGVLIIGDWTALVGDPSGRDKSRAGLTQEQIEANAKDYLRQVSKVIAIDKCEVRHNGEWFAKFEFADVLDLTRKITVQRTLERDDFSNRFRAQPSEPIYLSECLYPLMQGRDSVEINADIELGGSEQLYNLMVGRDLQVDAKQEPQICITMPILIGLDGTRRMGKSLGNYVGVGEPAQEQFDKIMSIPDTLMQGWFELLTDRPADEIKRLIDPQKTHPKVAKQTLAKDIVAFYHGAPAAEKARSEWERRFSGKQDPTDIPETTIPAAEMTNGKLMLTKLMTRAGLTASNGEARRLIQQGGVTIGPDRSKATDPNMEIEIADGLIIRVGNRRIVRIRVQ